jgi:outer membrane biosynthesis protein TonB
MKRLTRIALTATALSFGLLLAGCDTFDPTAIFDSDFFNTKKKLPGERKPVFPEGTPGVPQGVPQELVKGYQAPAEEPPPQQAAAPEAKPKPKPKPKVVAKPKEPAPQPQADAPEPPPRSAAGGGGWPGSAQPAGGGGGGGVAWPDPPSTTR